MAAIKGIDIDEGKKQENQARLDEIQIRVNARLHGVSESALENHALGFDFETDEDEE